MNVKKETFDRLFREYHRDIGIPCTDSDVNGAYSHYRDYPSHYDYLFDRFDDTFEEYDGGEMFSEY